MCVLFFVENLAGDHIQLACLGGANEIRNLVMCCNRYNGEKGIALPRPHWFLDDSSL